jgi:hypothetical protein
MVMDESIDRWWAGRMGQRHVSSAEVIMDSGYAQVRCSGSFRYLTPFDPFVPRVATGPEIKERHARRASEAKFAAHALSTKNVGLMRFRSLQAALDNVVGNCGIWPRAARESSWTAIGREAHAGHRQPELHNGREIGDLPVLSLLVA